MTLHEMSREQLIAQLSDLRATIAERERIVGELQQDNQLLRKSAKILDSLVHSSPEPMVVYDAEGRVLSVNPAFVDMFGWSRDELLGHRIDYVPEECRAQTFKTMERSLRGEHVPPFETRRLTKDGRVLDIQISAALFCNDQGQAAGHIVTLRDISQMKRAEEARKESEERYRLLTERISDIVWTIDLSMRTTYVSPSIVRLLGFTPEERMMQRPEDMMTPESYEHALAVLIEELSREKEHVAEPNRTMTIELEYYHKDGSTVWLENKMSAIRDEAGQVVAIQGISRDISDRKRAEEALRDSEQRYSSLLNSTPDLAFLKDEASRYVMINRACQEFFGRTESEILGKTDFELMPHDYAENCRLSDLEAFGGDGPVIEEEMIEGRVYEVKRFGVMLESGKKGIGGLIREVTQRKETERALRDSEQKYRLLIDHVQEAIFVGQDGMLKFLNPKAIKLIEYSESDLLSKPFTEFIHPDDRQMVTENHFRRLRGKEFQDPYTFRIIHSSGAIRWVELNGVVIEWEGRPATLAFVSDITDRKNSEKALLQSEERYRTLVENLNDVIFSADLDGKLTYISPVFERRSKYTCQEVIGRRFTDFGASGRRGSPE